MSVMMRSDAATAGVKTRVRQKEKFDIGPVARPLLSVVGIALQVVPSSLTSITASWPGESGGAGRLTVAGVENVVPEGPKL